MMNRIADKLIEALGLENVESLADMCERVKQRAVERQSEQSVSVIFNGKGYVRHINGSDNVNGSKPKGYAPE